MPGPSTSFIKYCLKLNKMLLIQKKENQENIYSQLQSQSNILCLSPLFSVSLFLLLSSPLPPSSLPGLFFYSPSTPADAISGSGQLSNISVGREKQCVCVVLAFWTGDVGGMVSLVLAPVAGGVTRHQEFHLASAWKSQDLRVIKSWSFRSNES